MICNMQHRYGSVILIMLALACFILLLIDSDYDYTGRILRMTLSHRQLSNSISYYSDPRSTSLRLSNNNITYSQQKFVIPIEQLAATKSTPPTITHSNPIDIQQDVVIDVISLGSQTRPEYLTYQTKTWATHPNIRHFWGLTEEDDYNANCSNVDIHLLDESIERCKSSMGWENDMEGFRTQAYGQAGGSHAQENLYGTLGGGVARLKKAMEDAHKHKAGWFCAQRRIGPAFGWIQSVYQDNTTSIPDILVLVDDDTSVDIENMKEQMFQNGTKDPLIGAACSFGRGGIRFAYGGYGPFFNKASILPLLQPIYCDERQDDSSKFMRSTCDNLQQNRVGELEVFENGDSIFDIFYKYAALTTFCMHSDWLVGYLVTYHGGGMSQLVHNRARGNKCSIDICDADSVTCHNQNPVDMAEFVMSHPQNVDQTESIT